MKLNKEQYIAAHHLDGPMLVLAGPGSGKTHLLVERIRIMIGEKNIPPDNILVITFSRKAARQMQARFEKSVEDRSYPVTFGTFHAVFFHILQNHIPGINRLITEEEQGTFVHEVLKIVNPSSSFFSERIDDITGMISGFKNFGRSYFEKNETGRMMTISEKEEFLKIIDNYDKKIRENALIDFDDMIIMTRQLFCKHESVLRTWQKKYRYFLVDEFQDINESQYDVLRLLAGDDANVFAVGDDDQSIYAFRGSRPELMKKFLHQYPGCRQVTLTMNYRCCENVIGAADTVIRHNNDRILRPMQRHLPSKSGGIVEIINSESTDVQAAFVCDKIAMLMHDMGYSEKDFAVLYRSDHCAALFRETAKEYGFTLVSEGGTQEVPKSRLIHEAYVRAHNGTATRADIFLIMNNPPRGLSREALCADSGNYIEDLKTYYENDEKMLGKVYELEDMIKDHDEKKYRAEEKTTSQGINVMTAHASKGLEFPVVFIIGLQEGLFPHHKSMSDEAAREERRLMYVAMTRAKERLYMCTVSMQHGKRPSRFVIESMEKRKYINDHIRLS